MSFLSPVSFSSFPFPSSVIERLTSLAAGDQRYRLRCLPPPVVRSFLRVAFSFFFPLQFQAERPRPQMIARSRFFPWGSPLFLPSSLSEMKRQEMKLSNSRARGDVRVVDVSFLLVEVLKDDFPPPSFSFFCFSTGRNIDGVFAWLARRRGRTAVSFFFSVGSRLSFRVFPFFLPPLRRRNDLLFFSSTGNEHGPPRDTVLLSPLAFSSLLFFFLSLPKEQHPRNEGLLLDADWRARSSLFFFPFFFPLSAR